MTQKETAPYRMFDRRLEETLEELHETLHTNASILTLRMRDAYTVALKELGLRKKMRERINERVTQIMEPTEPDEPPDPQAS